MEEVARRRERWERHDELLALIAEQLSVMRREWLSGHGVKPHDLPDVLHVPRPWDKPVPRKTVTMSELARIMSEV